MHAIIARLPLRRAGAVSLGVVALIGSLVAFPSAAIAAPSTTVRCTVTLAGHALADVPVGTWSATKGVLATTRTDAAGRFVPHSPSGVAVVPYAVSKGGVTHLGTERIAIRG